MKSVLDSIFIRRPRINYISPPICEVLFSSSAFPIIVLNPIHKKKGPTGLVIGGRGHVRLRWNVFPGALCYNVYVSGLISPDVSECHNADGSDCADPTTGRCTCCRCSDVLTLLAECIQFPEDGFPIAEFGCYYLSAITVDGESELSDPYCFNRRTAHCDAPFVFNPATFSCECPAIICPVGQTQNPLTCVCEPCPVQPCDPGFHWDVDSCACVPDGGCSGIQFVDNIGLHATVPESEMGLGGTLGFVSQDPLLNRPWVYWDRIAQPVTNVLPSPGTTGSIPLTNGNHMVYGATSQFFWGNANTSFLQTFTFPALGPGESYINPLRMQPDGAFLNVFRDSFSQRIGAHIYRPESNDFLSVGVTSPITLFTAPYDMNASRVVCGQIQDLAFNVRAVTIVNGTTATDVPMPADAPPTLATRQTGAFRINDAGSVLGFWSNPAGSGNFIPFVYLSGVGSFSIVADTGFYSLEDFFSVYISENNIVAGDVIDQNTGARIAFRWNGGVTTLLNPNTDTVRVWGVDNQGRVLADYQAAPSFTIVPSVYANGVWTSLADLGMAAAGWTNMAVGAFGGENSLTGDGFFNGTGTFNGDTHGFVAKLCP